MKSFFFASALFLLAAGPASPAERIVWKPLQQAVLKMDERPVKLWNVYTAAKKEHLVLVQLGGRFLLLDTEAREVAELDPATMRRKGKELHWENGKRKDVNTEAQRKNGGQTGRSAPGSRTAGAQLGAATELPQRILHSEEWSIRDVGPARIIRVRLSAEGRVLEVQVPIQRDLRQLY